MLTGPDKEIKPYFEDHNSSVYGCPQINYSPHRNKLEDLHHQPKGTAYKRTM